MRKRILTITLLLSVCISIFGQVDKEYLETLKKSFEVAGTVRTYQDGIKQIFIMFKQEYSEVESDVWNDLEKEFSESSLNELIESLVPVYSKYMSLEDLQELIKFYETPFGKKYSEITPMLVKEIFLIGDEWVVNVGQDLEDKIKEKGYINEP